MPIQPGRPCAVYPCPNLARVGGYCPEHAAARQRDRDRARASQQGTSSQRGYGSKWRIIRAQFLSKHPLCCDPDRRHVGRVEVATDVDHILPRARGGSNRWENLQALCHACHSAKTVRDDGGFGRKRDG